MSVCNLKYNVIFIHVPKAAGTSMEHNEFLGGGGHQIIRFFYRIFHLTFSGLPAWEDVFKFGFVRNPYDRLASAFTANFALDGNQPLGMYKQLGYRVSKEDFTRFVTNEEQSLRDGIWEHVKPQHDFLCLFPTPNDFGKDEKPAVDFVGHFENLQEDWKEACDRIGVSNDLSTIRHWGKNPFTDYDSLYTPQTRELVADIFKKDFEVFGYGT